jgi:REP element-mobilizing transposase RayT
MARPPRVPVMLPWKCKVIYFITLCIVPRCKALANDAAWKAVCETLGRLDKWNTYCIMAMPDHIHLLTAPRDRELSVAAFLKWFKRWVNESYIVRAKNGNGSRAALTAFFERPNRFTKSGTTFERIQFELAWSLIGNSGHTKKVLRMKSKSRFGV